MRKINAKTTKKNVGALTVPIVLPAPSVTGLVDPVVYPGLVSREVADKEFLEIEILVWSPASTIAGRPDVLDVHLDDVGDFQSGRISSEPVFFTPPIPTTYTVRVLRRFLTEGDHHVSYRVIQFSGNDSGSFQAPLIIDRTAPYDSIPNGPRRLTLPAGWPGSLTRAFLDANPGGVPFGIPAYADEGAHPGDQWRLYNGDSNEHIAQGSVFPDMTVLYTAALAEVADGPKKLVYRLVDVAGNISDPSFELPISVALNPAPVLGPAGVRDAISLIGVGDRLIDRADTAVSSGMFVIIPSFEADRTSDKLHVRLTTTHGVREIGPYDLGGSPLPYNFHVPFQRLVELYASSTGKINLRVEYAVERHGVLFWVPTATNVELELEVGGPVNPWEPDLVNPNLPLPVLTGSGSGLENELDERDANMDAGVVVPLWSASPLPSAQPFDIVLYYQNEQVDRKSVDPSTAMPGDEIPMTLAWPYIRKHSNNLNSLRYEIAIASTHNRVSSPTQDINVNANVIAFLAPDVVGALPEIPGIARGEIVCNTLQGPDREVHVFVPPHELLEVGMIIRVNWTGCSDNEGAVPIATATGTFNFGPLTFQQTQVGFNVPVRPYGTYVKPINVADFNMGSVHITYTVSLTGVPTPIDSAEAILLVRGVRPGLVYCDGTSWPS
ncbi:hypothetical protein HKK55_11345 [Pseudomonas sp. ADAK18]|uniref:hypothetical protein n=1 Tax=Pseudomonas sp. ADAK18 TaxID=2730848 RepID=UPI001462C5AB|nr:hypothetical protein [Pseudomonas sp. ADAK18]QJI29286.1 hypothetical protein HKK55_11345 [Pseudomonas sp. ADAK18]